MAVKSTKETFISVGDDVKLYQCVPVTKAGKHSLKLVPVIIGELTNNNYLTPYDFVRISGANEVYGRPFVTNGTMWYKERRAVTLNGVIKAGLSLPLNVISGVYNLVTNRRVLMVGSVISAIVIYRLYQDPKCSSSFEEGGKCMDEWFKSTLAAITAANCHKNLQGLGGCLDGGINYGTSLGLGVLKWVKSCLPDDKDVPIKQPSTGWLW